MCKCYLFTVVAALSAGFAGAAEQPAPAAAGAAAPRTEPTAASSAPAPPADPFIRDPRAAKPAPTPGTARPGALVNLLSVLETWSMSQADFLALLDSTTDGGAPYPRLNELATSGKAKLLGLVALTSQSGLRAVVQCVDEVRYASEFDPAPRAGELAFPTSWQTSNAGHTLELEAVASPDRRTIDLYLASHTVRFGGFDEWRAEAAAEPVAQPKFHNERISTSLRLQSGVPAFLSTVTPSPGSVTPAEADEVRLHMLRVSPQAAPPPTVSVITPSQVRIELLLYTLDRAVARKVLLESSDSAASHAAVRELLNRGEAAVEIARALVTRLGQRAVTEEVTGLSYPSIIRNSPSFALTGAPGDVRSPASFGRFENRSVGVILECEPIFNSEQELVEVNLVPQVVSSAGMLKVEGITARYPAQPLITSRKITTTASTALGVPVLLGTMNQPGDTGVNQRADHGKTTLAYIRVTPITP